MEDLYGIHLLIQTKPSELSGGSTDFGNVSTYVRHPVCANVYRYRTRYQLYTRWSVSLSSLVTTTTLPALPNMPRPMKRTTRH